MIRHVSLGADYETLDVLAGGKVPRGLHNAELSLVASAQDPETNIQVLERLCESLAAGKQRLHLFATMREILELLDAEFFAVCFLWQARRVPADLIRAAEIGLVRQEGFRKNAVKFWVEPAVIDDNERRIFTGYYRLS